ncbi:MAG: CPBP family intramembrane metalloprotease [Clostridiales bacterium]|nr:CPBP family intramembrane metalloprotease [Clostridiales bacterium]
MNNFSPPIGEFAPQESSTINIDNKTELKKISTKIGVFMIVVFTLPIIGSVLLGILMAILGDYTPNFLFHESFNFVFSFIFAYALPIIILIALLGYPRFSRVHPLYPGSQYNMMQSIKLFPFAWVTTMGINLFTIKLFEYLSRWFGIPESTNPIDSMVPTTTSGWVIAVIYICICAPIFEEIFYRRIILGSLRRYGDTFAIVISAILFGIMHGNFSQFFYAFALGLIYGYIVIRSNSILPAILLHALNNSISTFALYISSNEKISSIGEKSSDLSLTDEELALTGLLGIFIIALIGFVILGLIQLIKYVITYIIARTKKTHISYLFDDAEGLTQKQRYGIFFSRPTIIITIVLAVLTFLIALYSSAINEFLISIQQKIS